MRALPISDLVTCLLLRLLTLRSYYFPLRITIRTPTPPQQLKPCEKRKEETSLSTSALLSILSVSKHRKAPGEDDIPGLPLFIPSFPDVPGQISMFSQDYDDKTNLRAGTLYVRTDSEQISKKIAAVMIRKRRILVNVTTRNADVQKNLRIES